MGKTRMDLCGDTYGEWTVLSRASTLPRTGRVNGVAAWNCRCSCGTEHVVRQTHLRQGRSNRCRACGNNQPTSGGRTHGHTVGRGRSPTYSSWRAMKDRCTQKTHTAYDRYGGRGIKVCSRWSGPGGFESFMADMGERPPGKWSIGRKDNDGDYTPLNCRWETSLQQANNTRANRYVLLDGRRITIAQACRALGLKSGVIRQRMYRGMSPEEALGIVEINNA